jgi:hypothetical protein
VEPARSRKLSCFKAERNILPAATCSSDDSYKLSMNSFLHMFPVQIFRWLSLHTNIYIPSIFLHAQRIKKKNSPTLKLKAKEKQLAPIG